MTTQNSSPEYLSDVREDYDRFLIEYGFSHELVRSIVENYSDHIDMPPEYTAAELRTSAIQGQGLFATRLIYIGGLIAPGRIDNKRTHVGRFTNHSTEPNAKFIRIGEALDSDLHLITTRTVEADEELLVDYRQAMIVNGSMLKPNTAKAIETIKLRLVKSRYDFKVADDSVEQFLKGVLIILNYLPPNLVQLIQYGEIEQFAKHVGYFRAGLFFGKQYKA